MISTKSRIFLITVLIAIMVLAVSGAAAAKEYYIEELYMTVELPDDGYVITRDIKEGDQALEFMEMTQAEAIDYLLEDDAYLYYISEDNTLDMTVFMQANDSSIYYFDYQSLPRQLFAEIMENRINSPWYRCYAISKNDIVYIYYEWLDTIEDERTHIFFYETIINGQQVSIEFKSRKYYTDEDEGHCLDIISNLVIDKEAQRDTEASIDLEFINKTVYFLIGIAVAGALISTIVIVIVVKNIREKLAKTDQGNTE